MSSVSILGLGYIGLPTAALLAAHRINVFGIDINPDVVKTINSGNIHFVEPGLDVAIKEAVNAGYFTAHTTPKEASAYLIVVPTPFKDNYEPDISFIKDATRSIVPYLKDGDLYIIESTSPIGTTEKMSNLIFSERPELEGRMHIAYCPERVLPGNIMRELKSNDRVIGGINEESTNAAVKFYSQFVEGDLHRTNSKTAEMCKLTENSARDNQIAFANELSLICDKAGVDVWDLIQLANMHPRVNVLQPGCGVGGHCIAVDPYFLISDFPEESKIIQTAREINSYKTKWCIGKIRNAIFEYEDEYQQYPKVAILGMAFKPDVDDLRESPAITIINDVVSDKNKNFCYIVEPNIQNHDTYEITDVDIAIEKSDIVVLLVAHREFKSLIIPSNKILIDFCGLSKNYK